MEAKVKRLELFVDSSVEDPVKIQADELLTVLVGHWN